VILDFLLEESGNDFFLFVLYLALEDNVLVRLLLRIGNGGEALEEEDDKDDELDMMDFATFNKFRSFNSIDN